MIKRFMQLSFVFALAFGALGADTTSSRFEKLGHRLMCTCGCNQILLECNHVGCPASDGMRNELAAGMQKLSSDDGVLDIFVQKYGPIVLAAPTMTGFNRVAWLTPYVALASGFSLVTFVVLSWKRKPQVVASPLKDEAMREYKERARKETEL